MTCVEPESFAFRFISDMINNCYGAEKVRGCFARVGLIVVIYIHGYF